MMIHRSSPLIGLFWAAFAIAAIWLPACQATPSAPTSFPWERVPPENLAEFENLLGAIDRRDDEQAEILWRRLRQRLESQAESQDETVASEARWQLEAGQRFGNILVGRKLLQKLEGTLAVEQHEGQSWLMLTWKNHLPAPLTLRPGSAVLDQESFFMGPTGEHSIRGQTRVITDLGPWEIPPLGSATIPLLRYYRAPIAGALALRDGFALRIGSGSLEHEDERLPAERWPTPRGMKVHLAGFLPNASVPVKAWLEQLKKPEAGLPSIVERTVRLLPRDYSAALDELAPLVRSATPELMERYRPAANWLWLQRPLPVGVEGWRSALSGRAQLR